MASNDYDFRQAGIALIHVVLWIYIIENDRNLHFLILLHAIGISHLNQCKKIIHPNATNIYRDAILTILIKMGIAYVKMTFVQFPSLAELGNAVLQC